MERGKQIYRKYKTRLVCLVQVLKRTIHKILVSFLPWYRWVQYCIRKVKTATACMYTPIRNSNNFIRVRWNNSIKASTIFTNTKLSLFHPLLSLNPLTFHQNNAKFTISYKLKYFLHPGVGSISNLLTFDIIYWKKVNDFYLTWVSYVPQILKEHNPKLAF